MRRYSMYCMLMKMVVIMLKPVTQSRSDKLLKQSRQLRRVLRVKLLLLTKMMHLWSLLKCSKYRSASSLNQDRRASKFNRYVSIVLSFSHTIKVYFKVYSCGWWASSCFISWLCNVSGPMVTIVWSDKIAMEWPFPHIRCLLLALSKRKKDIQLFVDIVTKAAMQPWP